MCQRLLPVVVAAAVDGSSSRRRKQGRREDASHCAAEYNVEPVERDGSALDVCYQAEVRQLIGVEKKEGWSQVPGSRTYRAVENPRCKHPSNKSAETTTTSNRSLVEQKSSRPRLTLSISSLNHHITLTMKTCLLLSSLLIGASSFGKPSLGFDCEYPVLYCGSNGDGDAVFRRPTRTRS